MLTCSSGVVTTLAGNFSIHRRVNGVGDKAGFGVLGGMYATSGATPKIYAAAIADNAILSVSTSGK
jgi:hypothetical protein